MRQKLSSNEADLADFSWEALSIYKYLTIDRVTIDIEFIEGCLGVYPDDCLPLIKFITAAQSDNDKKLSVCTSNDFEKYDLYDKGKCWHVFLTYIADDGGVRTSLAWREGRNDKSWIVYNSGIYKGKGQRRKFSSEELKDLVYISPHPSHFVVEVER